MHTEQLKACHRLGQLGVEKGPWGRGLPWGELVRKIAREGTGHLGSDEDAGQVGAGRQAGAADAPEVAQLEVGDGQMTVAMMLADQGDLVF